MEPELLHRQQTRTLPFLVQKLIGDLENPEKILVFRQNEPMPANDLIDLRQALANYGPATLLWVQETRPGHPAGTVEQIDERLMVGYVRRLATRENAYDLDLPSWIGMLRGAYAIWHTQKPAAPPACVEIVFGAGGNARSLTEFGWSPPEDNHTFTIDDRSLLTFAPPADAPEYRLEMDIAPFLAPPALTSQRLEVLVNGELVETLDPVVSGIAVCPVPGRLIRGHDRVDILLVHPGATRPCDVDVAPDPRRLTVMFRRLTLTGMPASPVHTETPRPPAVEIVFGLHGQPRSDAEHGWSLPELDFTWAIDESSLLILPRPAASPNYRLQLDMLPFVHPPVLDSQRLEVRVNGALVHTFDPVPYGRSECVIPGKLVDAHDKVEILLTHPRAARPSDLDAGRDARRLAIMFRGLTLVGLPG
jgi:hypothetical protein